MPLNCAACCRPCSVARHPAKEGAVADRTGERDDEVVEEKEMGVDIKAEVEGAEEDEADTDKTGALDASLPIVSSSGG